MSAAMDDPSMGNMSASSPSMPTVKGRAKACTACRQVKLKCDAKELAPAPCSRCQATGMPCKIDQTFKRVPARKQLEEVSNRLNSLQRSLGLDQNPHLPASASLEDYIRHSRRPDDIGRTAPQSRFSDFTFTSSSDPAAYSAPDVQSAEPANFLELENLDEQGAWQLGDVVLDAPTVRLLFHHFNETHWRHVPFLEPCTSLHAYHQSSELLFWTVVLSSCFMFNEFHDVHGRLLPFHRQLLSTKMLGERASLRTVHALLLMCTWTYPVSTTYDDLTWIICGAAVNMAMVMGLHKPGHVHEYAKDNQRHPGSSYTRNCTWLACFVVSAGISAWLGMPPPLGAPSHLEVVAALCRDTSIPARYRARADIQKRLVQLTTSLDSPQLDFRTRHSLIKLFEQQLDDVAAENEEVWTDDLEIERLGAKLYLFGTSFVSHGANANSIETESPAVAAREVLQRGLAAAIGILDTISHMKLPPTRRGENHSDSPDYIYQLGFYPKYFFRIGGFANFFLLWFLAVDAQASAPDQELARTYITFTYRLMISFKQSPEHVRAGKAIEELARMPIQSGQPSALRVNTRLGASFMYSYTLDGAAAAANPNRFQILPTLGAVGEVNSPDTAPRGGGGSGSISDAGSGSGGQMGGPPQHQHLGPDSNARMAGPQLPPGHLDAHAAGIGPVPGSGGLPADPGMSVNGPPPPMPPYMAAPPMGPDTGPGPGPGAMGAAMPLAQRQAVSSVMFEGEPAQAWHNFPFDDWDPTVFQGLRMEAMDVDAQRVSSDGGSMM